jgi:DNA-binding transcriptional LysR family regulator
VLSGDLDAALIVEPEFAFSKSCGWRVLREEPLIVLTPAAMTTADPHAALQSAPFIRYDRSTRGGRIADDYLRRAGIRPRESFELASLSAIALLVDRGLGVTLVPDWPPPWPAGLLVNKLAVPDPHFVRRMGLVWNRASVRMRLVNAFLEEAAAAVGAR